MSRYLDSFHFVSDFPHEEMTLTGDEVSRMIPYVPKVGIHAQRNAAQAAMSTEEDREQMRQDLTREVYAGDDMSNEQGRPNDRFRRAETPPNLLPCRFCGHPAELWQRWEVGDIWYSFGACTNLEDVDGEPCHFHLPDSVAFYKSRKADAIRYWNLMMGPRETVSALERSTP